MNSLWLVFQNTRVVCLDVQSRKWTVYRNALEFYDRTGLGCLVTQDHLYIFTKLGVERIFINNEYAPSERIDTEIGCKTMNKFFPVPNENNQFYLIEGSETSIIIIDDDEI